MTSSKKSEEMKRLDETIVEMTKEFRRKKTINTVWFIEYFMRKAYLEGVKDSLGKLPKKYTKERGMDAEMEAFNSAIQESEANIKSLIE